MTHGLGNWFSLAQPDPGRRDGSSLGAVEGRTERRLARDGERARVGVDGAPVRPFRCWRGIPPRRPAPRTRRPTGVETAGRGPARRGCGSPGDQNASMWVYFTMNPRPGVGASGVEKRCSFQTT